MLGGANRYHISHVSVAVLTPDNTNARSPSVLFLDEPTSGLDSFTAHQVMKAVKRLVRTACRVSAILSCESSPSADYAVVAARATTVAMRTQAASCPSKRMLFRGMLRPTVPNSSHMVSSCIMVRALLRAGEGGHHHLRHHPLPQHRDVPALRPRAAAPARARRLPRRQRGADRRLLPDQLPRCAPPDWNLRSRLTAHIRHP